MGLGHVCVRRRRLPLSAAGLIAVASCATVDPRPDFDKAAAELSQVSGRELAYRPDDEAAVAARVEALLEGGLTLDEAVEVSLLNNPSLQAAFMDVGVARSDVVQAGLLSNPTLGLGTRFPARGGLANLDATIAQNIADLWRLPARRRAAENDLDGAILNLARRAADVATESKGAYYRAVGLAQVHAIALENLTTANELQQIAVAQRQAGVAADMDVNFARSAVLDAELETEAARLAAADARRDLARILGITDDPERLTLSDALPDAPMAGLDATAIIRLAKHARLDVRAARHAVASAAARLAVERRSVFGNVSLGLAMERDDRPSKDRRNLLAETVGDSIRAGAPTLPAGEGNEREHTDFIIGPRIDLEVPLFDQNQAGIARAYYEWRRAVKTREAIERPVENEVRGAVDRAQTAWRLVTLYRDQSLPLAERNVALSREAFRAGRTSLLGVLEAQRFLLTTRRRYVEAWQSAARTIPELERVSATPIGRITADDGNGENKPADAGASGGTR